jgi:glycosyltransferase involved in cell wall biosynthesis
MAMTQETTAHESTIRTRSASPLAALDEEHRASTEALSVPGTGLALPRVSVVMPTLNEAKNLPLVIARIPGWVHEIIIVDGRSTDATPAVALALSPKARIVLETKPGKGAALRAGFRGASGDIIAMLDADGSMDPAELIMFVGTLISGADFAKGSRFVQGGGTTDMSFYRMLGNWCLTQIVRVLYGSTFSDLCYGYNAFWAQKLSALNVDRDGFEIETAMNISAIRSGLKVAEVPSFESPRVHGVSNLRPISDGFRVLSTILREWTRPKRAGVRWPTTAPNTAPQRPTTV